MQLNRLDAFDDPGLVHAADEIADILNHADRLPPALARPVWSPRIPRVSRWFVGRDAIIESLANGHAIDSTTDQDCGTDVVHSGGAPTGGIRVISQTVSGLVGVGKTTVAAAVAERYQSQADIIWWVRAELPTTITDDMCALADRLGIAVGGAPPDRAEAVVAYLADTDRGWLIVFDNAVDERHVAPFIPNAGRGMVLVTTRKRTFNQVGIPFTIGTLPPEVAIEFLQDRVRESNPTAANDPVCAAVAAHLGGLPLALEQAGAWVAASNLRSFARYLTLLQTASQKAFADAPVGYDRTVWDTWQISIDAATAEAPLAAKLMGILGWFAPEACQLTWLTDLATDPYLDATPDDIIEALEQLDRYSLIATNGTTVDTHRVVQAASRRQSGPEGGSFAVTMLHHQRPSAPASEVATWPVLTLLAPHVEHAVQYQAGLPDRGADLWWLLDDCATARQYGGDPIGAVAVFETARMLAEQHFGDLHANTLAARGNLASSYRSAGRIPEAIILQEQVLADRVSVSGDHHRNTLGARGSLASSYWSAGRIPEAIILQERVLADRVSVSGDLHPTTLTVRGSLAGSYWSAGRIPEAITLQEQVLADSMNVFGDLHPDTLTARASLAASYWSAALANWQR